MFWGRLQKIKSLIHLTSPTALDCGSLNLNMSHNYFCILSKLLVFLCIYSWMNQFLVITLIVCINVCTHSIEIKLFSIHLFLQNHTCSSRSSVPLYLFTNSTSCDGWNISSIPITTSSHICKLFLSLPHPSLGFFEFLGLVLPSHPKMLRLVLSYQTLITHVALCLSSALIFIYTCFI